MLTEDDKVLLYKNMISYQIKTNYDELGVEESNEGFHDVKDEGLMKYNVHKMFEDSGLDNKFE